ncbi:mediator of RNA polymerase II transcription subunit 16 [Trichonephila clavipes]|nr:mediator of RNA polymerase II transcription subunit 16 [Trichonephila clavipes]
MRVGGFSSPSHGGRNCLAISADCLKSLQFIHGFSSGVASPALFMNSLPLQFEYHSQPEFLRYNSKVHTIEGTIPQNHKIDIVRHVSLGRNPSHVRQCTRCYSTSMVKAGARSAATRAWDQRWLRCCPCGGQWQYVTSKS